MWASSRVECGHRRIGVLTDTQARAAKPRQKGYRLPDQGGLFLFVTPAGGKIWRLRYRQAGREQTLTFGAYPEMSLADAREAAVMARRRIRANEPAAMVAPAGAVPAPAFELVAREWHENRRDLWTAQYALDVIRSLERDVFPAIGRLPIATLTPTAVLDVLRAIQERGAIETAHRVRQRISDVFVYAIASGIATSDPAAIIASALRPVVRGRQPAITSLPKARDMIQAVEREDAHPVTLLALRLLYLTAVRPGELRAARWCEFEGLDGERPIWVIPAARMKMKREHLVPLSRQAVEVIDALRPFSARWPHLFPNTRRPAQIISENALGYLLNRAGFHHRHVPHGFRSTFSTVMNEEYPDDRHIIDAMLAHVPPNQTEGAYNRALYLARRRELAQIWADLILAGQVGLDDLTASRRKEGRPEAYRESRPA
ncbi:tyrosine-type recombinase/integrase [Gluconacetobacter diazotrophicus]|uniref:tyrosine-type recombinase/integrase n=1 Tax=Gluconacetobacter diazotrophicus TaxID=33996 RepID=UPI001E32B4A3|nr:integrase arm-type DNA-binding domain-containing protein [Gluconacetobacter diazotrophicus]